MDEALFCLTGWLFFDVEHGECPASWSHRIYGVPLGPLRQQGPRASGSLAPLLVIIRLVPLRLTLPKTSFSTSLSCAALSSTHLWGPKDDTHTAEEKGMWKNRWSLWGDACRILGNPQQDQYARGNFCQQLRNDGFESSRKSTCAKRRFSDRLGIPNAHLGAAFRLQDDRAGGRFRSAGVFSGASQPNADIRCSRLRHSPIRPVCADVSNRNGPECQICRICASKQGTFLQELWHRVPRNHVPPGQYAACHLYFYSRTGRSNNRGNFPVGSQPV